MLMLDCAQSYISITQIVIFINKLIHSQSEGERKLYKIKPIFEKKTKYA